MEQVVINLTRDEDGGYRFTVDGDGFASGGHSRDAVQMLRRLEQTLETIEDRAGGGSGKL